MKKLRELAMKQGVLYKLKDEMVKEEFFLILEEDWITDNFESEMFLYLSQSEKKVYALIHAQRYAETLLNMEVSQYINSYGDHYEGISLYNI